MSAAAGCRQSRCRPGRRWLQSAAIILWEGPERGCPAPPRPPSVPPALSGSCLLLLLLLPVVQAPPSLLSFAARISLEFYSLPHVTHRVKLHLRRVTHQHSASPSRPGHRQQQPPPTEEPQPGSQPAPPSAECAAAAHGNSRARPGAARAAPPPRWRRNLPKAFGLLRARRSGAQRGRGRAARAETRAGRSALYPGVAFGALKPRGGNLQEEAGLVCDPVGEFPRVLGDWLETPRRPTPRRTKQIQHPKPRMRETETRDPCGAEIAAILGAQTERAWKILAKSLSVRNY
nr:uncharacterized protein LOC127491851 [Oryctolagus cuniculus]